MSENKRMATERVSIRGIENRFWVAVNYQPLAFVFRGSLKLTANDFKKSKTGLLLRVGFDY